MEIVVRDDMAARVVESITKAAGPSRIGYGKGFILPVEDVVRIRTGETGPDAL
jgi:nitrogen regulatory protein PII